MTSGDHSMVEPPGPIPNPEVKHCCADGSGAIGPVRVGRCQVYARLFPQRKKPGFFCGAPGKKPDDPDRMGKLRQNGGTRPEISMDRVI
jgi:hypothetical protein